MFYINPLKECKQVVVGNFFSFDFSINFVTKLKIIMSRLQTCLQISFIMYPFTVPKKISFIN